MNIAIFLLCLSMLLAPIVAAIPEDPGTTVGLLSLPPFANYLCVAVLVAYVLILFGTKPVAERKPLVSTLMAALVGWALLSTIVHAASTKLEFLSHMLKMTSTLVTYACAFASMRLLARHARGAAFAVALSAAVGGTIMAVTGEQEFFGNLRDGMVRINGTSTPDFLAGYVLLTIPVTIAIALAISRGNGLFRFLAGFAAVLQIAALFQTQSRFALVSLVAALIAFGIGLFRANRAQGKRIKFSPRTVALIVVGFMVLSVPVIYRLRHGADKNSGDFRKYTWQATVDMAKANPIVGTGPGTFLDHFPQYALAGFTRLAHETYLQVAAEMGIPAAILMIALIVLVVAGLWRFLASPRLDDASGPLTSLAQLPSNTVPLIAAALLAAIVGEAVQNLIDSDLYVFAIGLTFWAFAGLAWGLTSTSDEEAPSKSPAPLRWAAAAIAVAAAVFSFTNGVAAVYAWQAQSMLPDPKASPTDAGAAYLGALSWAPLDGKYPAEYGYRVLVQREKSRTDGIAQIRYSIERQPDSINYLRLGNSLKESGDTAGAVEAFQKGLKQDPNNLDMLIALTQISGPAGSIQYYRRIADIATTPVGTVRAIGDLTEQRFAIGDAGVADDALKNGDRATALNYERTAVGILETYAYENGSNFPERMAQHGNLPSPVDDQQAAALYDHAGTVLLTLIDGKEKSDYAQKKQAYDARYQIMIGDAFHGIGRDSDAKAAYQNALTLLATCTYSETAKLKNLATSKIQGLGQ